MVSPAWKADPLVVARAMEALAMSVEALSRLEAAGRLTAMGAPVDRGADRRADAEALVREGAFDAVETAAVALRALLDRRALGAGEVSPAALVSGVREALRVRDRLELQLLGAAAILGQRPALSAEQESALLVFEALIRPDLWRLTEANEARREALGWMAPAHRPAFWWWHEGADVAPHAVSSLAAVAHLLARFPVASEALASLVAAQRAWDEAGSARRAGASVVSLRAWVSRREGAAGGAASLPLAAATFEQEVTLIDHADYQVSWSPPAALVVDLVADRAPGTRPSLRLVDGTTLASEPVPDAEERFRFHVDAPLLEQGRVVLVLPLAAGTIELPLPPDAR